LLTKFYIIFKLKNKKMRTLSNSEIIIYSGGGNCLAGALGGALGGALVGGRAFVSAVPTPQSALAGIIIGGILGGIGGAYASGCFD